MKAIRDGRFHGGHALLSCVWMLVLAPPAGAQVMGWRGDGSGRFPAANPPVAWGRNSRDVAELAAQARKPADDAVPGKDDAIPDGIIRRWLVLGPVPLAEGTDAADPVPDAAALSPDNGVKSGDLAWQAVTLDTDCMDLCQLLNVPPDKKGIAAYALAYIYSPSGRPVAYNLMTQGQGACKAWLNGTQVYFSGKNVDIGPGCRLVLPLQKGWNRLLVLNSRTSNTRRSWWMRGALFGDRDAEYDTRGIAWMTPTPSPGASAPVIAGDRLFFTAENGSLVCASKADGKLLWVRTLTYYDFATEAERKANPEIFAELDPLAEKVRQADQSETVMPWVPPALEKDLRWNLETPLIRKMASVSRKKYDNPATWGCEAGFTACNPITDGERVYALFGTGIVACYDRNGNCQWRRLLKHTTVEHGYTTSPLLVDGKLVVYFDDFTVLDAKTGAVLAERPHFSKGTAVGLTWHTHFHGTGCVLPVGQEKVIYYLNGDVRRLSDGASLALDSQTVACLKPDNFASIRGNRMAATLSENGIAYKLVSNLGDAVAFKPVLQPADGVALDVQRLMPFNTDKFPYYYEPFFDASPLLHDGLLYCLNDFGVLTVLDVATGQVAYQRLLDLDIYMPYNGPGYLKGGASASPTLAGKYIYIFGDQGSCLVMEPGRVFKPVARNRVECMVAAAYASRRQEATISAPVFEGDRMYYRGEGALYCIGPR